MGIFDGICLLLVGVLAVPSLILSKRPDAKQVLDKITPFQGWIGLVAMVWGLVRIPWFFRAFSLLGLGVRGIILFAMTEAYVVTMIALGLILGIGTLKMFIKDGNAQAKLDQVLSKVLPFQSLLGLIAIIDGVAMIIVSLVPSILG